MSYFLFCENIFVLVKIYVKSEHYKPRLHANEKIHQSKSKLPQ